MKNPEEYIPEEMDAQNKLFVEELRDLYGFGNKTTQSLTSMRQRLIHEAARLPLEQVYPEVLQANALGVSAAPEEQHALRERMVPEMGEEYQHDEGTGTTREPVKERKTGFLLESVPTTRKPSRPAPHPRRFQGLMPMLAAVLVVCLILGGFLALFSSRHLNVVGSGSPYRWCIVPNPASGGYLRGVAAVSANDVWAVGSGVYPQGRSYFEHWNGKRWQVIVGPATGNQPNALAAIAVVSKTDIWAVGSSAVSSPYSKSAPYFASSTLIEHWNGNQWSIVPSPDANSSRLNGSTSLDSNGLAAVAAISANDIWAVGGVGIHLFSHEGQTQTILEQTLIEHWNGTRWSSVPNPTRGTFNAVAAVSANDVWVMGNSDLGLPLIEHWNGEQWSVIAAANLGNNAHSFGPEVIISASDVWALTGTAFVHWDGMRWHLVAGASIGKDPNTYLSSIAGISATDIWAVGQNFSDHQVKTLIEHWDGERWRIIPSPNGDTTSRLFGVATTSGGHIWAVGLSANEHGSATIKPLIVTLCAS